MRKPRICAKMNLRLTTRHLKAILVVGALWLFLMSVFWRHKKSQNAVDKKQQPTLPYILWWTTMPKNYASIRFCGMHMCSFGAAREKLSQAKAIIFYASDFGIADFPLPRLPEHIWALLHEESPRNVPFMPHTEILQHFNLTSTFSQYSDSPLTIQYLADARDLTTAAYMVPVGEKSMLRAKEKLAPVVFMQTDCDTMSARDDYVRELMKYIQIDSYGKCLHNRDLPKSLKKDYLNNLYSPELYRFLSRYKFILSYENGICNDYITEKFWRPLVIGSIPVYFGAPNIKDWEPNKKSVIHISDFASPQQLAEFLKALDANDTEYSTYLDHKYEMLAPISNKRLNYALHTRDYALGTGNLFESFECFVCSALYEKQWKKPRMATMAHYNCTTPLLHPPMDEAALTMTQRDEWKSVIAVGKCQAEILNSLLQRNQNYTKQDFENALDERVQTNQCN